MEAFVGLEEGLTLTAEGEDVVRIGGGGRTSCSEVGLVVENVIRSRNQTLGRIQIGSWWFLGQVWLFD